MRALHHKLVRDLRGTSRTLLSVVVIMAIGTGSFIGLGSAHRILGRSQRAYYRDYRFADFWIDVKKAPLSAVERLAELPGVASIEPRIVFGVILDLPNQPRPIGGRLVSTPVRAFADSINGLCLVRGSGFSDDRDEEVILSEPFARAHDLEIGERIQLILNRKRESFVIVGTALSPEYIYMVRGVGDIVPDPVHFGVLYVKEAYARDVLDFKDACNQIVGRFVPGTEGEHADLLDRMDRMMTSFGVLEVTPRERQASHRFVSDEIQNLGISATIVPIIFLVVAALILNVLMVRLADRQRTTIGTLKAIGYSDAQVMAHYLSYGAAVGVAGGVAGAILGTTLATVMIRVYHDFFDFPRFLFSIDPDLILYSFGISVFFAVLGTVRGVWAVLRLQPAEAMRLKPPERGGGVILERWPWLWRRFGFRTHMALRSVFRNRFRTATGIVSTAMAAAIMFMSFALFDAFKYIIDFQFDMTLRSDVDIGMRDEESIAALFESRSLPGVTRAEPMLAVRCDLQHGHRARRMSVTGLSPDHTLTIPMQSDGTPIDVPEKGLVLSKKLAELLDAAAGDHILLTPVRGRRETKRVQIASVVDTFLGLDSYADIRYLGGVVGESLAVNAVQLAVEPTRRADLYREVKILPNAQGLSVRTDSRANIEKTLIRTQMVFIGIIIVFAGSIAFGSAVNAALVEIGDRIREISTLRVLGYSPSEVTGILVRQEAFVFAFGLALGYPIGYALVWYLVRSYDTELLRVPFVIRPPILVYTAVLSFAFIIAAQVIVYRSIRRLNWLEGIQVKE